MTFQRDQDIEALLEVFTKWAYVLRMACSQLEAPGSRPKAAKSSYVQAVIELKKALAAYQSGKIQKVQEELREASRLKLKTFPEPIRHSTSASTVKIRSAPKRKKVES